MLSKVNTRPVQVLPGLADWIKTFIENGVSCNGVAIVY